MNREISVQVFRFFLLVTLQVLIFKNISLVLGPAYYLNVLIYPLFILLLPMNYPEYVVLLLAFVAGLSVDIFYDSPGVHASALVFTALLRKVMINLNEPKGGYTKVYPTIRTMGVGWFYRYATPLMAMHLLFYFSVEAFHLSLFPIVLLKTAIGLVASMLFVSLYMIIGRPKM